MIVALAITKAIESAFITDGKLAWTGAAPAFFAFFVTIVPFYHGMNRHLEEAYIRRTPRAEGALLFDFVIFFTEASLLVAFAVSLSPDKQSFVFLGVLLFVDTLWALVSNWIHYSGLTLGIQQWAAVNAVTIALGVFVYATNAFPENSVVWLLLLLATVRTVLDYHLNWSFYFPQEAAA